MSRVVLAVIVMGWFLGAAVASADPAAPAPAASPGPEAVAARLMELSRGAYGYSPGPRPSPQVLMLPGSDLGNWWVPLRYLSAFAYFALPPAGPAQVTGDTARVEIPAQPLEVHLKRVGDKWYVDMAATLAAFPPPLQNAINGQLCSMSLGRLGSGLQQYVAKHAGQLPSADTWREDIAPYVGGTAAIEAMRCPLAPEGVSGYGMNMALSGKTLANLAHPDTTVLLFESDQDGPDPSGGPEALAAPRHDGVNYYLMANWSVRPSPTPLSFAAPEKTPPAVNAGGPPPPN